MAVSFGLMWKMRGFDPFLGVTLNVLVRVSMSVHSSCQASPGRMPVSLSSWRKHAILELQPAMSWSISDSCGEQIPFLQEPGKSPCSSEMQG